MTQKSPAFQFYPQDYLASSRVAEMTLEEEGAYIRLLCYCWASGSIPVDPERCARLAGKGCSVSVATNVQRAFNGHPTDTTKLVHNRLEIERNNQLIRREQTSNAGKRSAELRANKHKPPEAQTKTQGKPHESNGRSTDVQRNGNPSSSSSSSSSSSLIQTQEASASVAIATLPAWQTTIRDYFDATFGTRSRITTKRQTALNARWKDQWWRDNWQTALDRGGQSAFLRGGNDRGWVIDFEFFLKPDTATKILEGKYDDRQGISKLSAAQSRENANADAFAIFDAACQRANDGTEDRGIIETPLFIEKPATVHSVRH